MGRKIRVFIILFLIIISGGIIVYNRINMNNEKKNGNTKTKIKKEIIQGDGDYKIKLLKAEKRKQRHQYYIEQRNKHIKNAKIAMKKTNAYVKDKLNSGVKKVNKKYRNKKHTKYRIPSA